MSVDTTIRAGVSVDGNPGPGTWGAIHLAVVGMAERDMLTELRSRKESGKDFYA